MAHLYALKVFKTILHKLVFHEMTKLEGVRLKTFKSQPNMDQSNLHARPTYC